MNFLVVILLLSLYLFPVSTAAQRKDAAVERKINALLIRMTLAEKLGQLQQLDGEANGKYRPEHLEMARKGLLGSTLNVRGAKMTNELAASRARIAFENSDSFRL